ncbi:TIGR04197 family type VII secretion effector [Macrococcus armenti]|uniref:TIGR04197 family type VII secretion effector n=1 Tax=Macrococcus armenti TaxID=2875764 RepID=UPI001CCCBE76|nr:TIGR04197 family type VII secretion effector [Macrococcus armenti]UBH17986.1 TIGR04197 family type VII secretion effector [Macrococcus armenti]UBH20251.1 TIGR04197 family type VII secretion effector [Macrococcus armenti]
MCKIQSDQSIVQRFNTTLNSSIVDCKNIKVADIDNHSTIRGNNHIHQSIKDLLSINQSFMEALSELNLQIANTANIFEDLDNNL